jgi:hypothetical protein
MKLSKVFRKAKSRLSQNEWQGICSVLDELNDVPSKDRDRALDIISERLGNFSWAHNWLANQVLYPETDYYNLSEAQRWKMSQWHHAQGPKAIQAWRRQWLDQLVAEFEAQGD